MAAQREKSARTPPSEWIAATLGAAMVLGTIGLSAIEAIKDDTPPLLTGTVKGITDVSGIYTLMFEVANSGTATAAQVKVQVRLTRDGREMETVDTTFDYVPAESRRKGGVAFHTDPRLGEVSIWVASWTTP